MIKQVSEKINSIGFKPTLKKAMELKGEIPLELGVNGLFIKMAANKENHFNILKGLLAHERYYNE